MNKTHVVQIIPALNAGGVERGTVDLACFLHAQEIKNSVISSGGYLESTLKAVGIAHLTFDNRSKNPFTFIKRIKTLRQLIRSEKATILHARSRVPAWLTYFANKKLQLPFITTCHGLHDNGFLGLKKFYNASLIKGDYIIAVSETVKAHLIQNFPKVRNKIIVIHRGIDCDYFTPQEKTKNKQFTIVLPGRISAWKGHPFFLKSFALAQSQYGINAIVLIVGKEKSARYLKKLQKLVKKFKLESNIQFIGPSNDMRDIYAQADLVVSSSIEPESFGRVTVEAMAMEKLVIATNIGGSKETMIHGQTGWLVEPNNINAMAKAIDHAVKLSADERNKIERAAREHVLKNFTLEQMMKETLTVYKMLAENYSIR